MHQPRSHPLPLFEGELAVVNPNLPEGLRLARLAKGYQIIVEKAGRYEVQLELLARITETAPWHSVTFSGPAATIGKITAQAEGDGTELELLSGTPLPRTGNDRSTVRGALGKDRSVNLRWQPRDSTGTPRPVDRQYHQHHSHQSHRGAVPHHVGL